MDTKRRFTTDLGQQLKRVVLSRLSDQIDRCERELENLRAAHRTAAGVADTDFGDVLRHGRTEQFTLKNQKLEFSSKVSVKLPKGLLKVRKKK